MKVLFWTAGAFLSIAFGVISYLAADNQPPYDYDVSKSYIKPSVSQAGHQVTVHWEVKINRICKGFIVRNIIDSRTGAITSYDPVAALGLPTGDDFLDRTFFLPEGMGVGPKLYRVQAEYNCNLLQNFFPLKVQTPDLHFVIE